MTDVPNNGSAAQIRLSYHVSANDLREANAFLIPALMTSRPRGFFKVITTAAQVLMIFGVFAVIWMVHSILTKGHPLPIGLIFLGGVLGWGMLLLTGLPASWRMRAVVELPAGTTSEVTFDAQSIHTRSDAEESRCEWRAVHILARDNSVVLVGIPGAGMPIPISAFTEIETDFAQLQAWRAAGGSA